jgi:Arylsulfotransferase (ASST)
VAAQFGFISDIHEFLITPANTALLLSTRAIPMNLGPYGGPAKGYVQDFAVQEIDLQTNNVLFFWDAPKNIPLTDSYEPASSATSSGDVWDVYHLNAISLTDSPTDILVSSRNTWTIYRINKPTGCIVWRLGGKQSSFTVESGAAFSWQHDARFLPNNVVSIFDDNCCEIDVGAAGNAAFARTVPSAGPHEHDGQRNEGILS